MSQAATIARRDTTEVGTRRRSLKRVLRPLLMLGGLAVVAVAGLLYWLNGGRTVSIDDAYIQADKLAISTDISGIVATIPVHEGEAVKKGQVLFTLDPLKFQIALDGAKANLVQTALNVEAMKRDYQRMLRDIAGEAAQVQLDQINNDRMAALARTNAAPRQSYDNARFRLAADQQKLEALHMQAQSQLAKLSGNANVAPQDTPQYREAQAKVAEAQRELDHTVVRAPFDGIVTQVSNLQPGQYLAASTAAFALVSTDHVWAEGNPKETELTWVKSGDPATVSVDTYPGESWKGAVQSIAPASGSSFSILPAQNSSGNWVKVVQRIPVRVRIDRKPDQPVLRNGMSVEIDIDTGHTRRLSDLF